MAEQTPAERIAELRIRAQRVLKEVFTEIEEAVDSTSFERVVMVTERIERERDDAQARVTQLESELAQLQAKQIVLPQHTATIIDAAVTLRNAIKGIADTPISTAPQARVIGQANKAVEAFNEQTAGML